MRIGSAAWTACAIAVLAARADAQDAAAPPAPPQSPIPAPPEPPPPSQSQPWTIRFEPMAWYVSPGGTVEFPDSSVGDVRMEDLNLDSPRLTPFGELLIQSDRYGVVISGFAFEAENRGALADESGTIANIPFSTGDRLITSMDFVSVDAAGWYRFYESARVPQEAGGFRYRAYWDVMVGGRLYDYGLDIRLPGGVASEDSFMIEPIGGVRFGMDIIEQFTLDVTASLGYFSDADDRQSVSWDIAAGFQWNPSKNLGIQVGFRQLAYRLHDGMGTGEFELNGALAGLYFGGIIRF